MNENNVNFMLNFYLPNYKNAEMQDKREYYSSRKYNDYIKYVDTGIKDLKNIDYVEYANNSTKSSGVFNADGKMSKEQIADMRKNLRETKSVIWSAVISFEEKFGLKWCNNHEQAEHLLQKELPKFFKSCGLKPDNMIWFAGLHENTDNRHVHLIFFEKEAIRNVKGKKAYSIGKLSLRAINNLKANLELSATDYEAREIKIRTDLTKSFKEEINEVSNLKLKSMLLNLAKELPKTGHTYYDCEQMQELKNDVDNISNYIINHNPKIKGYKDDFDDVVFEKQELIDNYCSRNHCKNLEPTINEKIMNDIYRRLGNDVIKKAKKLQATELERIKLNAIYKSEKQAQKKKLLYQIEQCMKLDLIIEYEAIKAFQEYMYRLEVAHIKQLIEQGYLSIDDVHLEQVMY